MFSSKTLRTLFSVSLVGVIVLSGFFELSTDTSAMAQRFRRGGRRSKSAPQPTAVSAEAKPAQPQKPDAAKPDAKDQKKESGDKKPGDDAKKNVKRPDKPTKKADPEELKIRPDEEGKIKFNFHGQPWEGVLDWLADVSDMTLNWQELPPGFVNLKTQRRYTVQESRNMINGILLTKGFTLLQSGEVLSVANIKTLDSARVPRVTPEELAERDINEYVKVSFPLVSLIAAAAKDELQPMMSPNGKLTPLTATNRLEAMDAVANLREVYAVLTEEQSSRGHDRLVRNFPLKYTRAQDVKVQLESLLGGKPKPSGPASPQQAQMQMQMQQMRMQQRAKGVKVPDDKVDFHLVANQRDNSILASAPPDKITTIEQAILIIDQPIQRTPLLRDLKGVQVYRLAGLDPTVLVKTLEERGDLSPMTRLEVDAKHNAIIAFATPIDHATIGMLVQTLDGSGRQFHVIQLRRLDADVVAGTIEFMMGAGEEKEDTGRRRYYSYFGYGQSNQNDKKKNDKFRVDADVENNKLLLFANDIEYESVQDLLEKLGEIPPAGGNPSTVRYFEIEPGKDTDELLERIRRAWPSFSPNRAAPNTLDVTPAPQPKPEETQQPDDQNVKPADAKPNQPDTTTKAVQDNKRADASTGQAGAVQDQPSRPQFAIHQTARQAVIQLAQLSQEERDAAADENAEPSPERPSQTPRFEREIPKGNSDGAAEPPPISITRGPNGGLIIRSEDTKALDILEQLMSEMVPPPKDFKVIELRHADAYWVKLNLEDFFKEEDDDKNKGRRSYDYWYYGYGGDDKKDSRRRLSKRKPLKFIDDYDTNTILVQGASPEQLRTIDELIQLYDRKNPAEAQTARLAKYVPIRYSKAAVVAETIKEVYRDLLSSNDKSLASQNKKGDSKPKVDRIYTYIAGDEDGKRTQVHFKGLLSIGVDPHSNSLIISATENLMTNVMDMVTKLDEAAKPSSNVQVVKIDHRINSALMRQKLAEIFGEKSKAQKGQPKPEQPRQAQDVGGKRGKNGKNASAAVAE